MAYLLRLHYEWIDVFYPFYYRIMKKKKEKQSKATKFLVRNNIWFKDVIPMFILIGVACAGIASCQADFKQID